MGAIRTLDDRVEIEFEMERLLKSPVVLWDGDTKTYTHKSTQSIEDSLVAILWLRLGVAHPEINFGEEFGKFEFSYDKKTGNVTVKFFRKVPTSEGKS